MLVDLLEIAEGHAGEWTLGRPSPANPTDSSSTWRDHPYPEALKSSPTSAFPAACVSPGPSDTRPPCWPEAWVGLARLHRPVHGPVHRPGQHNRRRRPRRPRRTQRQFRISPSPSPCLHITPTTTRRRNLVRNRRCGDPAVSAGSAEASTPSPRRDTQALATEPASESGDDTVRARQAAPRPCWTTARRRIGTPQESRRRHAPACCWKSSARNAPPRRTSRPALQRLLAPWPPTRRPVDEMAAWVRLTASGTHRPGDRRRTARSPGNHAPRPSPTRCSATSCAAIAEGLCRVLETLLPATRPSLATRIPPMKVRRPHRAANAASHGQVRGRLQPSSPRGLPPSWEDRVRPEDTRPGPWADAPDRGDGANDARLSINAPHAQVRAGRGRPLGGFPTCPAAVPGGGGPRGELPSAHKW